MSYALLMIEDPAQRDGRTEAQGHEVYERMVRFAEDLESRGLLVTSQALASTRGAVRLRKRDGKRTLIDGPFAEAKEMIGGFFVLTCGTMDEAVAVASECPAAEWLTVEIRKLGPCFT